MTHNKGNILLIDHQTDEINTLASALKDKGYTAEICYNGEEGLERVYDILPDCIVSEVDLPLMDGYELCRKIREIPRLENVPFVFISSREKNGEHTLKGLRLGADDFVNRPVMPTEVILRVEIILKRLKILRDLTITDEVTSLFNRRYFDQRLDEEAERLKRYNRHLGVWVIDIDHFKSINDNYGHSVGDEVLRSSGLAIQNNLRKSDVIARYGGDEFAIIMPEHPREGIESTGERLRQLISDNNIESEEKHRISITISLGGLWISETNSYSANDIIRIADSKLYDAKNNGRNRVELEIL